MTTSPAHFLNMLKFSTGVNALSLNSLPSVGGALSSVYAHKYSNASRATQRALRSAQKVLSNADERAARMRAQDLELTFGFNRGLSPVMTGLAVAGGIGLGTVGAFGLRGPLGLGPGPSKEIPDYLNGFNFVPDSVETKYSNAVLRRLPIRRYPGGNPTNTQKLFKDLDNTGKMLDRNHANRFAKELAAGLGLATGVAGAGYMTHRLVSDLGLLNSTSPRLSKEIPDHLDGFNFVPDSVETKYSNPLNAARQLAVSRSMLVPRIGQRIDAAFDQLPLREALRPATQYTDEGLSSMLIPRIGQRTDAAFDQLPLREALRPATQYTDEGLSSMLIPRIGSKQSNVSQRAGMLMNRLRSAASGARAGFNSAGRVAAAPPPPSLMQRFRGGVGSVARSAVPIAGVGAGAYAAGGLAGYGAGFTNAGSFDDAISSTYDTVSDAYGGARDAVTEFGQNVARQGGERINQAVQSVRNVQLPSTVGEAIDSAPRAAGNALLNLTPR